jgi:hypothetical protein
MGNGLRFRVLQRDEFTCRYCGAKAPDVLLEVDHVVPKSKGGTNSFDNFVTACQPCNRGKRDREGVLPPTGKKPLARCCECGHAHTGTAAICDACIDFFDGECEAAMDWMDHEARQRKASGRK